MTKAKKKAAAKTSTRNLKSKKTSKKANLKVVRPTTANETGIVLEDNAFFPEGRIGRIGSADRKYPLASMEVGQTFFVSAAIDASAYASAKEADKAQSEACRVVANRLAGVVRRFKKGGQFDDRKFVVRTVNDVQYGWGVRLKRVEIEGSI